MRYATGLLALRRMALGSPLLSSLLGGLLLCSTGHARGKQVTHYEAEVSGSLIAVDTAKHLVPVPGVRAQLKCIGPEKLGRHENRWCSSSIVVTRGGQLVARRDRGLLGVDIDMVAGNDSKVTLHLVGYGDGASLLVLRSWKQEGDEQMRESATDQVLVIDGAALREVYRFESRSAFEPGPDGDLSQIPPSALLTTARLRIDGGLTLEVPNLIQKSSSGRTDPSVHETVLTWNGSKFVECSSCTPTRRRAAPAASVPPAAPAAPAAAVPPAAPAAPTTAAPLKSAPSAFQPLLVKVLRGERLAADELKVLDEQALSRLRNAAYARHGRPFKSAALQAFFYGPRSGGGEVVAELARLVPNPAFVDAMLDDSDHANVALVLAESRRRAAGSDQ